MNLLIDNESTTEVVGLVLISTKCALRLQVTVMFFIDSYADYFLDYCLVYKIPENSEKCPLQMKFGLFRCLVLSSQLSETQRDSVFMIEDDENLQIFTFKKAEPVNLVTLAL